MEPERGRSTNVRKPGGFLLTIPQARYLLHISSVLVEVVLQASELGLMKEVPASAASPLRTVTKLDQLNNRYTLGHIGGGPTLDLIVRRNIVVD